MVQMACLSIESEPLFITEDNIVSKLYWISLIFASKVATKAINWKIFFQSTVISFSEGEVWLWSLNFLLSNFYVTLDKSTSVSVGAQVPQVRVFSSLPGRHS